MRKNWHYVKEFGMLHIIRCDAGVVGNQYAVSAQADGEFLLTSGLLRTIDQCQQFICSISAAAQVVLANTNINDCNKN